jgi:hypothetical protein
MRLKITIIIILFFTCASYVFSQYVRNFPGAWYNDQEGAIYIVRPVEDNRNEITHVTIDSMFRVTKEPETGIVNALNDTSWRASDDEYIVFEDRTVRVSDVIYAPLAQPIDLFGYPYGRKVEIIIPTVGDALAKRIYQQTGIEIIKGDTSEGFFDLLDKLSSSRLVVFNGITDPPRKYIIKDMKIIDFGERVGEADETIVEKYNDYEAVIIHESYHSSRGWFPGNFIIRVYYRIFRTHGSYFLREDFSVSICEN